MGLLSAITGALASGAKVVGGAARTVAPVVNPFEMAGEVAQAGTAAVAEISTVGGAVAPVAEVLGNVEQAAITTANQVHQIVRDLPESTDGTMQGVGRIAQLNEVSTSPSASTVVAEEAGQPTPANPEAVESVTATPEAEATPSGEVKVAEPAGGEKAEKTDDEKEAEKKAKELAESEKLERRQKEARDVIRESERSLKIAMGNYEQLTEGEGQQQDVILEETDIPKALGLIAKIHELRGKIISASGILPLWERFKVQAQLSLHWIEKGIRGIQEGMNPPQQRGMT